MIITRTPFRISFFGGGTDYPSWYKKNGGATINCAINKYCYINARYLPPFFNYNYRIRYFLKEEVKKINQIQHPVVRECLNRLNFSNKKIEIVHNADLPAQSGLGTSSAFTVGLLHALNGLKNHQIPKKNLAYNAIEIEQNRLKENVGSQDQMISAFGGLNYTTYNKNNNIIVQNLLLNSNNYNNFENSLVLIFTNLQREASKIAKIQVERTKKNLNDIHLEKMIKLTEQAKEKIFLNKKFDIKDLGEALKEQWEIKKKLSNNISNTKINNLYSYGIKNGALGGKLLGAGGGGFILFIIKKKDKKNFLKKFNKMMHVPIKIDNIGSQIIYYKN